MRNLAGSTSPNGRSFGAPFVASPAEPLQTSYCLVNEDDLNASVERPPRTSQMYPIPSCRKPSPARCPETRSRGRSTTEDAAHSGEPRSPTRMEGGIFRRESTQTVKPTDSGLTTQTSSLVPQDRSTEHSEQQLIMPLITLPDRRPFTEIGKALGGLKILVAGAQGTGKTALIRAILQCCEHIVQRFEAHRSIREHDAPPTMVDAVRDDASELCQDYELDTQYDKNICFVDTPGHGPDLNPPDCISLVRGYIESHLTPHLSSAAADADMLKLLSASGGSIVSTVLYLISPTGKFNLWGPPFDLLTQRLTGNTVGLTREDMQVLLALQQVTNIIPVISHADTLSVEEVASVKEAVAQQLAENYVRPFTFSNSGVPEGTVAVYAISSSPGSEFDLTDASLLVNSEYIQPLVTTDLARLVDDIFCPNGASWLRHSAAKAYLEWRKRHTQYGYGMDLCLAPRLSIHDLAPAGGILRWRRDIGSSRTEDELLDDWAAALRRSLSNNVIRNANLLQLTHPADMTVARRREGKAARRARMAQPKTHQDPLGLLQILGSIKHRGQTIVEVVGTVGVLGTFGVWMWYAGAWSLEERNVEEGQ
ncbi:unnamed protein product [Parascedosporium putredinis]|uniref:Septin-type G domain-containing protein n=1 Tax=Parascedosporium putredinis TaxID=1442378 RepID=A0A9P1HCF1_9PEZI|nr:unnamed protein product [Parascedosporium putredinis]CAI8003783.1 unnamed protein product [Parascedosporium putredinis]